MCAASGRTNYRYVNQERCFAHDELREKKEKRDSLLSNTEFGLCLETKRHWWDLRGSNVIAVAVSLLMLQRLAQWDLVSMLARQTGWCYMMSSHEHAEGFATLVYIGLARRKKAPFIKTTVAPLLGLAARLKRICSTAHQTHIQTNPQWVVTKNTPAIQSNVSRYLFLFDEILKGKIQRRGTVWHLIRLPLYHSTLSLWGTDSRL